MTKMNQRADSWKENFWLIVAKPLICLSGWLLSHSGAAAQPKRIQKSAGRRHSTCAGVRPGLSAATSARGRTKRVRGGGVAFKPGKGAQGSGSEPDRDPA